MNVISHYNIMSYLLLYAWMTDTIDLGCCCCLACCCCSCSHSNIIQFLGKINHEHSPASPAVNSWAMTMIKQAFEWPWRGGQNGSITGMIRACARIMLAYTSLSFWQVYACHLPKVFQLLLSNAKNRLSAEVTMEAALPPTTVMIRAQCHQLHNQSCCF